MRHPSNLPFLRKKKIWQPLPHLRRSLLLRNSALHFSPTAAPPRGHPPDWGTGPEFDLRWLRSDLRPGLPKFRCRGNLGSCRRRVASVLFFRFLVVLNLFPRFRRHCLCPEGDWQPLCSSCAFLRRKRKKKWWK